MPIEWQTHTNDMTVEKWGQREYDIGHKAGKLSGIKLAVQHIAELAAKAFLNKDDQYAIQLRDLSTTLIEKLQ